MKIGFSNYTPQRTNFKGLFEVKNHLNESVWVNTDHVNYFDPNFSNSQGKTIHMTNGDKIELLKNTDADKILNLYEVAAGGKSRIVRENGVPFVRKSSN